MANWIDCREPGCASPAEPVGPLFKLKGVNYDGKAVLVWFEHRLCATGHRHQVEVYEEEE